MNAAPRFLPAPRKQFGQNFLTDINTIGKIIAQLNLQPNDRVLEIGPGRGALTTHLHGILPTLWAVELDRDLVPRLRERFAHLQLHEGDALAFDYAAWAQARQSEGAAPIRLVGNLPYNIATPLIFRFVSAIDCWHDLTIMVQKEVAERMMAQVGSLAYGRLSVTCQYYYAMKKLVEVRPGAFFPPPKVMSTVLQLIPKTAEQRAQCSFDTLSHIVKAAFATRRKKLSNCLQGIFTLQQLREMGIADLRAENLSLPQYINLARLRDGQPLQP